MISYRRDAEFSQRFAEKEQNLGESLRLLRVSAVKSFVILVTDNLS